jgi:hypothetical protein
MADCCAEIRAELAALRAEIAKIKPVDENRIIRQAILGAEGSIIPQIAAIAGTVFFQKISPFNSRLGGVERAVTDATALARQALERAYAADSAARTAGNVAQNALSSAGSALSKIGALAAKVAGIAALIASILGTLATIAVLGGRIDALENAIANLSNGLSQILGLINPIKQQAQRAESKADTANDKANQALAVANGAAGQAGRATEIAQGAANTAQNALTKAISASETATQAKNTADAANRKADEVRAFVKPLPERIDEAKRKADDAKRKADEADRKAEEAKRAFPPVRDLAKQAKTTADEALKKINDLIKNPPKGLKGEPGRPGRDGKDGKDGITRVFTFPGQPGKDGKPGQRGLQGLPGRDGKDGKNGKDGKDVDERFIKELDRKIGDFPKLIAAIPKPLTYEQTVNAAATGTCRTTQPGGCTNKLVNNAKDSINSNTNSRFDRLIDFINLLGIKEMRENILNMRSVLGNQLFDKFGQKVGLTTFTRNFTKWSIIDRVMNLMTTAITLHNAAMLSNDLGSTLIQIINNVIATIGLKDSEDREIDVGNIIKGQIADFLKKVLGLENFVKLTLAWKKANRIYQASANVLSNVRNIFDHTRNIVETTNINVADIGNALRQDGVVRNNAYEPMSRRVGQTPLQRMVDKLDALSDAASSIESVTSSIRGIKDEIAELTKSQAEFNKAVNEGFQTEIKKEKSLQSSSNPPSITEKDEQG